MATNVDDYQDVKVGTCTGCGQDVYLDTYSYNPSGQVILTTGEEGGSMCPARNLNPHTVTP